MYTSRKILIFSKGVDYIISELRLDLTSNPGERVWAGGGAGAGVGQQALPPVNDSQLDGGRHDRHGEGQRAGGGAAGHATRNL